MTTNRVIQQILAVLALAGVFYANYYIYALQQAEQHFNASQDSTIAILNSRINTLDSNVYHLINNSNALAESVLYLDSCQTTKTTKQDRAERRGRFVGGLLKGLFPGL